MRVTLCGHATVLVEAGRRVVLIDPVFGDPFGEGMLTSCPTRRVQLSQLPKVDLVILTDGAADHFDIPSLARLPRDVGVLCPDDFRVRYALDKLGFRRVRPSAASTVTRPFADDLEVVTTPSPRKAAEFGVILKDRTGVLWHPVAVPVSAPLAAQVRAKLGRVDLLLAGYTPQNFGWFGAQRTGFPGQFLRGALASVRAVAPRLCVAGTHGMRFAEPFDWTNAFLFPISRARFLADLSRAEPALVSTPGDPGDVFEITPVGVERRIGSSSVVKMIGDDTWRIDFDPTASVPPLRDPNLDGYPEDVLVSDVARTLDELTTFIAAAHASDPVLQDHARARGSYGLGVVFPDGSERWLRATFETGPPRVERGDGPIRGALNTQRIAASVLTARARCERGYPYPGGLTRGTVISPARLVNGEVKVEPREPPDLLFHYLRSRPPGWPEQARRFLDFQLRPYLGRGASR